MDLADIWKLVQSAGPFASALLLYLYLDERTERRAKDKELASVLERSVVCISEVKQTLNSWLTVFGRDKPE